MVETAASCRAGSLSRSNFGSQSLAASVGSGFLTAASVTVIRTVMNKSIFATFSGVCQIFPGCRPSVR